MKTVELSDEAEAQVDQVDLWWRANRLAAPELFTHELNQALTDLGFTPSLGTVYKAGDDPVRRLLLR
ncbi:MAG: hypothetical protein IT376_20775 [Polyangiaceae bacterium]|nr:hypothetical protein [Polyangiaceae bacterium]